MSPSEAGDGRTWSPIADLLRHAAAKPLSVGVVTDGAGTARFVFAAIPQGQRADALIADHQGLGMSRAAVAERGR